MFCYVHQNFAYIKMPKNGSSTYADFFEKHGWVKTDLFYNDLDLDNTIFFGHITEPNHRHTKGIAQYLLNTHQMNLLDHELERLLVSGVFDEHCYSIHMMIPHLVDRVNWIPLDYTSAYNKNNNGDSLTNDFFKKHNLNLRYLPSDRLNTADLPRLAVYNRINELKVKYNEEYQKLVKNFLEPDLKLYNNTLDMYYQMELEQD